MTSAFGIDHGQITKNALDDAISENHDGVARVQPRYVRDEKGRFLSNTPVSPFGVARDISEFGKRVRDPERENKVFGSPLATAAVVGGVAGTVIGRNRANRWGGAIGTKVVRRGNWSAARAAEMKNKTGAKIRGKYAQKVQQVGEEMRRSPDTREWTARVATGGAAGTTAGGLVYGRKKLTPTEKKKT